jgi:predicted HTH domain antitoxin
MMTTTDRLQVNIRLEPDLLRELDDMAAAESLDRAELARRLLREGLRRERIAVAVRRYRDRSVSAGRAAELAGISLYEMLDRIHADAIPYELGDDELSRIDASAARRRGSVAVGEHSTSYGDPVPDDRSGIDALRSQFRPRRVRWLFVGESSPAGRTHFYHANSNLFRATQAAYAQALGQDVPSGPAFLHWFQEQGAWLVDVADRPVNRMSDRERTQTVAEGVDRLASLIDEARPERILTVKASIAPAVRAAIAKAGVDVELIELPFPVRQWRAAYVRELSAAIGAGHGGIARNPNKRVRHTSDRLVRKTETYRT